MDRLVDAAKGTSIKSSVFVNDGNDRTTDEAPGLVAVSPAVDSPAHRMLTRN